MSSGRAYPSDVSDEEWALVARYLCLLPEDCGQRRHPLRELFNGLRYVVRHGIPWRAMPNDLPPWAAVHQQAMRWLRAGCFEALASDLREVLRVAAGRAPQPTAAVLDSRTLRPTFRAPAAGMPPREAGDEAQRVHPVHGAAGVVVLATGVGGVGAGRPFDLRCPACPRLSDDEATLLHAAALAQRGDTEGAESALRPLLSDAGASFAVGPLEGLGTLLGAARQRLPLRFPPTAAEANARSRIEAWAPPAGPLH